MAFMSVVIKTTKHEKECHILNLLLLLLLLLINIVSYIKFIKIIIYKLFEGLLMGAHKIFINESFLKCFNITFTKNNIKIVKKINFFSFFIKYFLKYFIN